jgi:hypothetical protein
METFECAKSSSSSPSSSSSSSSSSSDATVLREPWSSVLFASTGLYPELFSSVLSTALKWKIREEIRKKELP